MSQINTAVQVDRSSDEDEIGSRNFNKLKNSIEKEGYREGTSDGRDSIFQISFDKGYEDGFKIGFLMGNQKMDKSSRGNCNLCKDPAMMSSHSEAQVRKLHEDVYNSIKR